MRERVELGLRENAAQFALLVAVNAMVGAMVGLERSTLPLIGEQEFGLGSSRLALTVYGGRFKDVAPPAGTLLLQLAFRVPPAEVAKCAELLESRGVEMTLPVTDQPFGHRTVFFRDPDGNVLEIYAEI